MNIFANEGAILHQDALSFHLSHQPPLYVSIHFLLHELVQLVLILLHEIKSTRTQVVDGSNESLEHADEDLDTLLRKYSPLQKIFKKSSVHGSPEILLLPFQNLLTHISYTLSIRYKSIHYKREP